MYYEINVSKEGQHLFATAKRSIISAIQARVVYYEINVRFPAAEGFKITLTKYELCGSQIDPSTLRG